MERSGSDRRQWPRIPAAQLNGLSASIVDGPALKLVNLSRGGALVESPARYPMRSAIQLAVTRPSGAVSIKTANVSWAQVASIVDMRISYLLAFTFDTPIDDFEAATGVNDLELESGSRIEPTPVPPATSTADAEEGVADVPDADLREQLAAAMSCIAENSTATQVLVSKLEAADAERTGLRAELAFERQRRQAQTRQATEAAETFTRIEMLERALAARDREHQQALDEARAKYEAVVSELMNVANAQEVEFQRLLAERTAGRDQQYARAEYMAAELARLRAAGARALAEWDAMRQELTTRAEQAETRCAEYEKRTMISPIVVDKASVEDDGDDCSHAVA